jgi:putative endonuclease
VAVVGIKPIALAKLTQGSETDFIHRLSFPRRRESIMMEKEFYVYILANKRNGTLYPGVSSDLIKRIWQHKNELLEGFTKKYTVKNLVYYEVHNNIENALNREKRIKKWRRAWKLKLIEENNPEWQDLYGGII